MQPLSRSLFGFREGLFPFMETPSDPTDAVFAVGRVGCRSDRNHFGLLRIFVPTISLWVVVGPRTTLVAVAEPRFTRVEPAMPSRKEGIHFGRQGLSRAENQRFALPAEPQLFIQPFGVDVVVHLFQRFLAIWQQGMKQTGDLRRIVSFFPYFAVGIQNFFDDGQIDE